MKKTPTGAPSTDEEVLQKLAEDYPLPKVLLEYRGLSKLKSTYTDKLPKMVEPEHRPRAYQLRAGGGGDRPPGVERSEPAEHPGAHRRRAAHPRSLHRAAGQRDRVGRLFADRAAHHGAHLGRRKACCAPLPTGEDIHRATAAEIFSVAPADVTSEQRRYAKVINFGLIYGMSAFGLASNLGIERARGADLHRQILPALIRR